MLLHMTLQPLVSHLPGCQVANPQLAAVPMGPLQVNFANLTSKETQQAAHTAWWNDGLAAGTPPGLEDVVQTVQVNCCDIGEGKHLGVWACTAYL